MYLQHDPDQAVYKFKYFTPDSSTYRGTILHHGDDGGSMSFTDPTMKFKGVKSFLEPDEHAFQDIRNRLSTLTLNTAYKKGKEPPLISPPFQRERKLPPRRISSIGSREALDRTNDALLRKPRNLSRSSFLSDDKEYRHGKQPTNYSRHRASETAALNKLNENILTPGQNPELFSRQIQLKDKAEKSSKVASTRSSSPKSFKSIDSSGKVHLGLIESLDLNEKLHDVEKIKERYSNNTFMNSLTLYKLRGHDRCLKHDGTSDHIHRGTRLASPDGSRTCSKMSSDSAYAINNVISPRLLPSINTKWQWEPDKSHVDNRNKHGDKKTHVKRKKSVGFNMEHREHSDVDLSESLQPPPSREISMKEIKSILKRSNNEAAGLEKDKMNDYNQEDEFVANESYNWKLQLPKLRSPIQSLRARAPMSFRRKMYHYGDGVSDEFEQVISAYGNCRQRSWVRDQSFVRENSYTSKA